MIDKTTTSIAEVLKILFKVLLRSEFSPVMSRTLG